jgi:diguanylate cyclase (GGDEF)-like protein/PAS domain S-box-containing protein
VDDDQRVTNAHAFDGGFFAAPDDHASPEDRLRDLQARYRNLVDHLPAVVYLDSVLEGQPMVDVSSGVRELLGVEPQEWIDGSQAWETSIHPEDRERVVAASDRSVETGDPFRVEYRAVRTDGRVVWIREDAVLIHDEEGRPLYWLGAMLDVTELIQAQEGLRDARSRYGALVEQIPAIVYVDVADESMVTTYVSPQIEEILGITPHEYLADPDLWTSMLHPDDRARALETYVQGRESGEPFSFEYRLIARDGRVVWFQDSALVLCGPDGTPASIHGVMLDITERKEAEERLTFLAFHDNLTGLPNKSMFDELLGRALARARRSNHGVAVLALDVDNFKLVNDSLGHEAGDRLIVQVADRLEAATRETDLVARQGGDEFLLLIADIERDEDGKDGAERVAETVIHRVRSALERPFVLDDTELYVTVSIGVSVFPQDAPDAGSLLRNADAAMFRAKRAGPGAFALHRSEGSDALSRLSLSTRLRKAVEQKAWALHYQPLVNLLTGETVGVEALIRWPDPQGGLVPPGEFIPLAEEMGLIETIGDWVVEEVCRQDAAWRAEGLELEIGFNLSPRELWQVDPVERVAGHLEAAGMDPGRVTVEITESAAMNDPDRIIEILCRFRDRGLRLAIDDFGTGYSSLSRLRYMPVDILKIDRTFIREVHNDPQSASMVSAIIALASNLGMLPLAEGIETEEEWRFLADRGCEHGQGFYFSRPVPPGEILAMFRRQGLTLVEGGLAV